MMVIPNTAIMSLLVGNRRSALRKGRQYRAQEVLVVQKPFHEMGSLP